MYAVGVVFMSLLNLPRHVRYNQENFILCGLIPGPKEPSLNVNSFLEPLIEDLLLLWRGKEVDLPSGTICMRAALICISCDSPAMRKVGGFLSHNARKGCYKCTKSFPTASFGEKPDYSGFDRNNWTPRNHSEFVEAAMNAKTGKERQGIERSHGVRYTVLLSLPYYNAITFCMIDPMHNLLLGSAKTFVKLWIQRSNPSRDFSCIQKEVDAFITPAGFGRLPRKVENGFANFKAQQWKNWILMYSKTLACNVSHHRLNSARARSHMHTSVCNVSQRWLAQLPESRKLRIPKFVPSKGIFCTERCFIVYNVTAYAVANSSVLHILYWVPLITSQ